MPIDNIPTNAVGALKPFVSVNDKNIILDRAPTIYDQAEIGTISTDSTTQTSYILQAVVDGQFIWNEVTTSGAPLGPDITISGDFTSISGDFIAQTGDVIVQSGNVVLQGTSSSISFPGAVIIGAGAGSGNPGFPTVAIGRNALAAGHGNYNIAIGDGALSNPLGVVDNNVVIGAGSAVGATNIGASIIIGSGSGTAYTGGSNVNIIIGTQVPGVAGEAGVTRIGMPPGFESATFICGISGKVTAVNDAVPVLIDSAGQLGTTSSSSRYKENITNLKDYTDAISKLRPVGFNYKSNGNWDMGLVAEEVEEAGLLDMVVYKDEQPETLKYQHLPILLLQKVQQLEKEILELKKCLLEKA